MDLVSHIDDFFEAVAAERVEIYNEFSLQHELGIHLRHSLGSEYKVQFERPIGFFGLEQRSTVKKEIDISIFLPDQSAKYAIELKFPRNGQYPEQMFSACTDIAFLEDLVRGDFKAGLFVMAADDYLFYRGRDDSGLYACFRAGQPIHGLIKKPTGAKDKSLEIAGSYVLNWEDARKVHYTQITVAGL